MIGAHGHGGLVLRGLKDAPQVELTAISAGCADHLAKLAGQCRALAGQFFTPAMYDDWRRMLDLAAPDIVCVDGPFEQHAAMCAEAFRRNIHVLVEKPAALSMDELRMLEEAHRASRSHLTALMNFRYHPAFYAAWQSVQSGALGAVRIVNAQKSYILGQRPVFFKQRATFGGTIPWVGSHAIDWVRWYSGADFERVAAFHSRIANRGHGDLESTAVCNFRLRDGILAAVTIDYLRPASAGSHGDDRVRVIGTDGYVEVRDGQAWAADANHDGLYPVAPAPAGSLLADFVAQIEGRGACRISAADVWRVTEACLLARQSADDGRLLEFS